MLLKECALGGVELVLNARGIRVERGAGGFRVGCSAGDFRAEAVVVATGGLSIPKMGATGLGYELARQFGLKVATPRPGLVPLVLGGEEKEWTELAGVSGEVEVWAERAEQESPSSLAKNQTDFPLPMYGLKPVPFREKMLVTHRGLSGPAILQASSYWQAGEELVVDFAPGIDLLAPLTEPGARRAEVAFRQALRELLPQRLAGFLADRGGPKGWSNAALKACERRLHGWTFHPVGTEGFEKAEVTAGGVDTDELHAKTMEARKAPGLYFIGEVADVTGWLGGFNFQWAWASGAAAGRAV
jgi:hypothetical protein